MKLILNKEKFGWSYTLCCKVAVTIESQNSCLVAAAARRWREPHGNYSEIRLLNSVATRQSVF
jgi:hypothetical protein